MPIGRCRMHGGPSTGPRTAVSTKQDFRRSDLKPTPVPDTRAFVPTSIVLQRLHDEAPADHFTLAWLMAAWAGAPSASSCSC